MTLLGLSDIPGNEEQSQIDDLLALTDEQILDIGTETQDPSAPNKKTGLPDSSPLWKDTNSTAPIIPTSNQDSSEPPKWLADMMEDERAGGEARDFWQGIQQARQESAAYREVFAKPEEARATADRARQMDIIDRAYYTGDSNERARLAATLLREDPAAFREMVEAGQRLLQEATGAQRPGEKSLATAFQGTQNANLKDGVTSQPGAAQDPRQAAQLAAYAMFERAANEDLERSVGGAITRTIEQALPNLARNNAAGRDGAQQAASLQQKLASAVRQDVDAALQGDRQLGEQVAQIVSSRRFDNAARAQVVRLISERAQQLVPGATKRVLNEWTQTTLAAHRGRTERSDTVSLRREVEPAASSATSATPPKSQQNQNRQPDGRYSSRQTGRANDSSKVDYRNISDEQILDM